MAGGLGSYTAYGSDADSSLTRAMTQNEFGFRLQDASAAASHGSGLLVGFEAFFSLVRHLYIDTSECTYY